MHSFIEFNRTSMIISYSPRLIQFMHNQTLVCLQLVSYGTYFQCNTGSLQLTTTVGDRISWVSKAVKWITFNFTTYYDTLVKWGMQWLSKPGFPPLAYRYLLEADWESHKWRSHDAGMMPHHKYIVVAKHPKPDHMTMRMLWSL